MSYLDNRRNRLKNLTHRTAAGVLMLGLAYAVDASSLRTQIVASAGCAGAADAQGCASVAGAGCAGATKVGNRLTRNCVGQIRTCNGGLTTSTSLSTVNTANTYDSNDRLTREVWSTGYNATFDYAYDPAGNLLTKKQGTTTLAAYSWDVENRLVQAVMTPTGAAGNRTTSQYQYDASGIRRSSQVVAQIVGTGASITKTRTSFLVDPNQAYAQVLEDWTAKATQLGSTEPTLPEASLQNSYVFGDDLIAEARYAPLPPGAVGANAPGEGGNDPTARIGASTGTSAFHYDGLGSTRLLSAINLDAAGNPVTTGTAQNPANETITDHYAYSAFGESDLASTTGSTENNYRYTGEQLDPNLGFYYLRARYMNPGQGRFVGMDSYFGNSSDPPSLHKYMWANNSPTMYADPSGLFSIGEAMATVYLAAVIVATADGTFGFNQNATHQQGSYYHHYTTDQITICTKQEAPWCSANEVWQWMRRMPAPRYLSDAYLSTPLNNGDNMCCIGDAFPFFFGGQIKLEVGKYYVNNVTTNLHTLAYGRVDREVIAAGDAVKIRTNGHGENRMAFIAWANDRVGPRVFNAHDAHIRRNVLTGPLGEQKK